MTKHQLKFVLMAFEEQIEAFISEESKRTEQVILERAELARLKTKYEPKIEGTNDYFIDND